MSNAPLIRQLLQHEPAFMGYLLAMTGSLEAAREIWQNVAVVILDSGDKQDVRDFRAWAKEIVRRQALHYLRENRARLKLVEPELLDRISQSFAEDDTAAERVKDELEALRRCVAELPEKSRALFQFRFVRHAPFDEIARELGGSGEAVQRAVSRMRKALRDCVLLKLRSAGGA